MLVNDLEDSSFNISQRNKIKGEVKWSKSVTTVELKFVVLGRHVRLRMIKVSAEHSTTMRNSSQLIQFLERLYFIFSNNQVTEIQLLQADRDQASAEYNTMFPQQSSSYFNNSGSHSHGKSFYRDMTEFGKFFHSLNITFCLLCLFFPTFTFLKGKNNFTVIFQNSWY